MESPSPEDKVQSAQSEDNSESEGPHTQEEPEVNTTTWFLGLFLTFK